MWDLPLIFNHVYTNSNVHSADGLVAVITSPMLAYNYLDTFQQVVIFPIFFDLYHMLSKRYQSNGNLVKLTNKVNFVPLLKH